MDGLLGPVIEALQAMLVRFHADGIDAHVWAHAACHLLQRFDDVDTFIVDDLRPAIFLGHFEPLGIAVDGNDAGGLEGPGALDHELAHRPAAPDGDSIARLDAGLFGGHISRWEDIR
jgi:hypothetical protein